MGELVGLRRWVEEQGRKLTDLEDYIDRLVRDLVVVMKLMDVVVDHHGDGAGGCCGESPCHGPVRWRR